MTTTPPELTPPEQAPSGAIRCPRCGAEVAADHDWCLGCGYAARTTIARTPRWRAPIVAAAAVAALALAALAVAFVDLTDDPGGVTVPTTQPTVLSAPPPTTPPPVTTGTTPITPTTPTATTPTVPTPTVTTPTVTTPTTPETGGEQAP